MRRTPGYAGAVTAAALVLVLVVALAIGDREVPAERAPVDAATPALAPEEATSSAWYCAAGTSHPDGAAPETVRITNMGDETLDAVVAVLAGRDEEPAEASVEVEPRSTLSMSVADVLPTPDPGVVVETFGGSAFVEHEISSGDDVARGPCATAAATDWYFGYGTTAQGAQQFLLLFNPFGDDASVDISLVTETGFAHPERLQGFTVPRGSRVAIPIHDEISRSEFVATHVGVRIGRVVAEQMLILDGSDTVGGRSGVAVSLGSTSLAAEWRFPWAGLPAEAGHGVAVANFGTTSGELTISIALDGESTLPDQVVPIPPRTVTFVDMAGRVPSDLGAAITLRADRDVEVIAEQIAVDPDGGIATMVGETGGFRRWVFSSPGRAIALFNPGDDAVEVDVSSASGDDLVSVEIPGGDRIEITQSELEDAEGPLIVEATAPVLAARVGSFTVSSGVVGR